MDRVPAATQEPTLPPGPSLESSQAAPSWRRILTGTPREVLARLVQDDPIRVRPQVAARLKADALLLDADRVHLRAVARIARFAPRYRGRPELSAWIESAVAEAIDELLREDHESTRSVRGAKGGIPDSGKPSAFAALAPPLGLAPDGMRAACAAFNALPFAERTAFLEFVVRGCSLDDLARAGGESATEVARRARRALDVLLSAALPGHEPRGQA